MGPDYGKMQSWIFATWSSSCIFIFQPRQYGKCRRRRKWQETQLCFSGVSAAATLPCLLLDTVPVFWGRLTPLSEACPHKKEPGAQSCAADNAALPLLNKPAQGLLEHVAPYSYSSSAAVDAESLGKLLAMWSLLSTSNPHSTLATGPHVW